MVELSSPTCTACIALAPEVEALKQDHGDRVNVLVADVAEASELAQTYRVVGIPAFLFFNSAGEKVRVLVGPNDRIVLDGALRLLLQPVSGNETPPAAPEPTAILPPAGAPVTVGGAPEQGKAPKEMEIRNVRQEGSRVTMDVVFWLDHSVIPGTVSVLLDGQALRVLETTPDVSSEAVSDPIFLSGGEFLTVTLDGGNPGPGAIVEVQLSIEEKGC
jgi:thiol-disulfide isomerase/thioredoxin